ncbi:putative RNA polymerase II subunit B1 CTD phosphatase rpap2 isoform X2 [Tachysurus fulvidraco]|uniref:putative RNA polymerase II subunit B1 CTD phosphatase rpap2 isoform X2 n=1 Tax=Tachysurus fulvidraco TaxID=1234273 RepID=UPI001FEF2AEB|nr:putative RNA polymerase II subunit B1 CTD phosphatase rpap2 isoform X2 [Tachysurus fulvidraco]
MEASMEAGEKKQRARSSKAKGVKTAEEEERRKEVFRETLREKLELERRALQVVERLLDNSVTEDFLIDCTPLITPANYRDAVEERSIARTCGYPVCSNTLANVPSQKYKICTKANKVYDITERKCFCSNFCYKASKYLEVQISKSPLWLRKEERPPEVKLLKKGDGGTSGLEVKLSDKTVSKSNIETLIPGSVGSHGSSSESEYSEEEEQEQGFVSSVVAGRGRQRRVHWGDLPRRDTENQPQAGESRVSSTRLKREKSSHEVSEVSGPVTDFVSVEETSRLLQEVDLSDTSRAVSDQNSLQTSLNISQVGMSKKTAAGLRNLLKSHGKAKAEAPAVTFSILGALTHTLMEWRTEETMRFLNGPDYTSHSKTELQRDEEEEEELDEDDLEDIEKVKHSGGGSGEAEAGPSAAAPDYETLKRETEMLELRVHEFYRGVCVLPEEVQTQAVEVETHSEETKNIPPLVLVDSQAQRAIQRRIVVEKLCRSLRDVVGPLGVTMSEIINDINAIVRTFRLTSVSPSLRESMTKSCSLEYISSLMKELRLKDEDLQSLVKLFRPDRKAHATLSATERYVTRPSSSATCDV